MGFNYLTSVAEGLVTDDDPLTFKSLRKVITWFLRLCAGVFILFSSMVITLSAISSIGWAIAVIDGE